MTYSYFMLIVCYVMLYDSPRYLDEVNVGCGAYRLHYVAIARPDLGARESFCSINNYMCKKFFVLWGYRQRCSPRDQSLGLQAPRGQTVKSWSWDQRLGLHKKVLRIF